MIHERQVISASLWDLRAHHEKELRTLGVAQRAVDAWRATPTEEQRSESLDILQTQLEHFARSNAVATELLTELARRVSELKKQG